jgi:hypothetical protein
VPSPGEPVAVEDARTSAACPALRLRGRYTVEGGCVFEIDDSELEHSVTTPVGTFMLARCFPVGKMRIDRRGRFFVTGFGNNGIEGPCGDVHACRGGSDERPLPWRGQLSATRDDRFVGQLAICMATCVGRFEGRAEIEFVKTDKSWRVELDHAQVGPGALELDGSWTPAGSEALSLRPTPQG